MLTGEQVRTYLERIGFERDPEVDKDTLDELVWRHQCAIPFSTVSIHRDDAVPSTEVGDLFDKVIVRGMGGYCFELNRLFEELLATLGFEARPVLSRAVRGREGRMPINHRGILVKLPEGECSVDVGFGGPMPAGALMLEEGVDQVIQGETFAATTDDGGLWWKIERITRANFDSYDDEVPARRQVELELCTAPVEEQDFQALNHFFAQPGTLFRDHEIVNLRTPDGYLGYKDGVLTVRSNGQKTVEELSTEESVLEALSTRFGMAGA